MQMPKRPSDTHVNPRRASAAQRTLDSAKAKEQPVEEDDDEDDEYQLDGYDDDEADTPQDQLEAERPRMGGLTRVPGSSHIQKLGEEDSVEKKKEKSDVKAIKKDIMKDVKHLDDSDSEYDDLPRLKQGEKEHSPKELLRSPRELDDTSDPE